MDRPFFETIDRRNDSTVQIRVYSDSALTQLESTGGDCSRWRHATPPVRQQHVDRDGAGKCARPF